jgi:hypothetical protein
VHHETLDQEAPMFFSVHTMTGDPDDLMERKERSMDPIVERLASEFGAVFSVTVRTGDGITTYNLWDSAEGAAAFSRHPEAIQAQKESGLPMPSTFERHGSPQVTFYSPKA